MPPSSTTTASEWTAIGATRPTPRSQRRSKICCPVIDNLERALEAPATGDADSYRQGVELIYRQMLELLRRRGVTAIESVGTDFDPQVHQAVAHEASSDHREGEVMEELRRGYKLGDRLLRPAMVKVAKA